MGIGRGQNAGRARNPAQAEDREHQEPDQHHRTEDAADEGCSLPLDEEENGQDDDRDRHDQRCELRRVELQALDGAQHRNRWRDRAVAIEERRPDQAEHQNERAPAAWRRIAGVEQGEHGHDAALATVVGAQDQDGVFQRDDEDQGPEHEREDAEHRARL